MEDKIVEYRGIRGLVGAILKKDDGETLTYGEVFKIAGVSELTKESSDSTETHYYDNKGAVVISAQGEDEVSVNVSAVPLNVIAKITGQTYDETTGALVEGPSNVPNMAIGYITTNTDGEDVFVWRLKGKFTRPGSTHKVVDKGTSADGQTLKYTGVATEKTFVSNNNKCAYATIVPAQTCGKTETEFFATVQTPDDIITAETE